MFEAGQRVRVLVDKAYSTEHGMLGREGVVLDNASSSDVVTYVKLDGKNTDERYVLGRREACEVFGNVQLEPVEKHSEFEVGQKVRARENGLQIPVGEVGVVTEFHTRQYPVRVKFPSGRSQPGSLFLAQEIEAVPTKKEENMQEIKVGDKVRVVTDKYSDHNAKGSVLEVGLLPIDRRYPIYAGLPGNDGTLGFKSGMFGWQRHELELVKPAKAKSQKISIDEVQVGDEIVSFRTSSGVETRRKGVVGKIVDGVARTIEGNILTHFYNSGGGIYPAHHVYLLNRPEPKKPEIADGVYYVTSSMAGVGPWQVTVSNEVADWKYGNDWQYQAFGTYKGLVDAKKGLGGDMKFHAEDPTPKGFDALDKTKVYFLKSESGDFDWYLAYVDGSWKYGYKGNPNTHAYGFERQFTEGNSSWAKPVEWVEPELTDLEKFERAGLIGARYQDGYNKHLQWKVTAKGNIKGKHLNIAGDKWETVDFGFDTLQKYDEDGTLVEV